MVVIRSCDYNIVLIGFAKLNEASDTETLPAELYGQRVVISVGVPKLPRHLQLWNVNRAVSYTHLTLPTKL
ncbi:MAG: hypothetical protein KUG59_06525, partial [Parvibaculaceae bacterium]|nr:hypothetical protein [Parvibaculaceae bacterium]